MNNFNLKDNNDSLIMYLIVNSSLNMGVGKTAAQVGHAVQVLTLNHMKNLTEYGYKNYTSTKTYYDLWEKIKPFNQWLDSSYRKVVLRADEKEWEKLKLMSNHIVVQDAGLTEITPGSETVIGFPPMLKSEAQKTIIKKLQILK